MSSIPSTACVIHGEMARQVPATTRHSKSFAVRLVTLSAAAGLACWGLDCDSDSLRGLASAQRGHARGVAASVLTSASYGGRTPDSILCMGFLFVRSWRLWLSVHRPVRSADQRLDCLLSN